MPTHKRTNNFFRRAHGFQPPEVTLRPYERAVMAEEEADAQYRKHAQANAWAVHRGLDTTALTGERIDGLLAAGFDRAFLAGKLGVSGATLRHWQTGATEPHPQNNYRLDDVRAAMSILILEKGYEPYEAVQFMLSGHSLRGEFRGRPTIDSLLEQPDAVLNQLSVRTAA